MSQFDKRMAVLAGTVLVVGGLGFGCAHKETRDTANNRTENAYNTTANNTDREANLRSSGVVAFEPGSAELTPASKEKLRDMVNSVRAQGDVDKMRLAVWSDKEFPVGNQDLSKADRDLASKRIDAVKDFISKDLDVNKHIEAFNMAERTNWLARLFRTDDAELKSALGKRGGAPLDDEDLRIFRDKGQPSHAVLIIDRKLKSDNY